MAFASAQSRPAGSWRIARRVVRIVGAAREAFRRHRRYRHELGELAAMNDHALRDIGISRCEVRGVLWYGEDLRSKLR